MGRTLSKATLARGLVATLLIGALSHCAAVLGFEDHEPFPIDGGVGDGGAGEAGGRDDADTAALNVPTVVGSRITLGSAGSSAQMALPAGAKPGDVVIAVVRAEGDCTITPPPEWIELGRGYSSSISSSRTTSNWIGNHALQPTETDLTTYEVKFAPAATFVIVAIVVRGARAAQPVAPVVVDTPAVGCDDAGVVSVAATAFTARGNSRAFFVIGVGSLTPFGFPLKDVDTTLLESPPGTAVYMHDAPFANGEVAAGPRVALPIDCAQRTFNASFGVVAE